MYNILYNWKVLKRVINFLVMITLRVIPVPIPNTEVKPKCAENTCGLPCWKDRLLLDFFYLYKNEMQDEISDDELLHFMKEQFEYLIDEFNVHLIVNETYALKNNLHSLKLALEHLSNSYVVPCDVWCDRNPFRKNEKQIKTQL